MFSFSHTSKVDDLLKAREEHVKNAGMYSMLGYLGVVVCFLAALAFLFYVPAINALGGYLAWPKLVFLIALVIASTLLLHTSRVEQGLADAPGVKAFSPSDSNATVTKTFFSTNAFSTCNAFPPISKVQSNLHLGGENVRNLSFNLTSPVFGGLKFSTIPTELTGTRDWEAFAVNQEDEVKSISSLKELACNSSACIATLASSDLTKLDEDTTKLVWLIRSFVSATATSNEEVKATAADVIIDEQTTVWGDEIVVSIMPAEVEYQAEKRYEIPIDDI